MTTNGCNRLPNSLSTCHFWKSFKFEKLTDQKVLTLVGTIAATYVSFQYVNKYVSYVVLAAGSAYFLFGSFDKFLDYVSGLLNNPPSTGTANMYPTAKTSGGRASQKGGTGEKPAAPAGAPSPGAVYSPPAAVVQTEQGPAVLLSLIHI